MPRSTIYVPHATKTNAITNSMQRVTCQYHDTGCNVTIDSHKEFGEIPLYHHETRIEKDIKDKCVRLCFPCTVDNTVSELDLRGKEGLDLGDYLRLVHERVSLGIYTTSARARETGIRETGIPEQ